jgi:hypothetical protein
VTTVAFGETVEKALSSVGVTADRVSAWLGRPCGCKERREKLDVLGFWAVRVARGKIAGAKERLERLLS